MAAAKLLLGGCGAGWLAFLMMGAGGFGFLFAFAPGDEDAALVRIEVATSRAGSDFVPAFEGKTVRIAGHVTEGAFWNLDSFLLPIRDEEEDFGLLVQGVGGVNVRSFSPGDVVEATGRIVRYNGMPVLAADRLVKTAASESTGSRQVALAEAGGFRNLGLPVEVEGRVTAIGDDGASEWLMLSDGQASLRAVLPKLRRDDELRLSGIRAGDRVRVSGVITQNAILPPYDRFFQLTILAPERLVLLESAGMVPALLLLSACGGIGLLAVIWWVREQRNRSLRRIVRPLHVLGEEILAMTSLSEMLKKIGAVVPGAARVSGVQMYLYDRKSKQLELVRSSVSRVAGKGAAEQVNLDHPANGVHAALGHCYRNRIALGIPDTRRSEFFKSDSQQQGGAPSTDLPRSILALPMLAQDEIAGVLLLYRNDGVRYFHHEEQASAQHLANQVAASLKLLEQRSVREQLFKSEKLAATGQLIAGVVNDLRNPVESVLTMSQLLLFRGKCEERDLRMLAAEAQRTAEIVTRLVSFGRNEDAVAKPVELNGMLTGLVKFREREWKAAGIQLQDRMSREGVYVIGAQGQLEQVLLNILLYAERAVADTGSKVITVGTSLLGRRVLADVDFPAPPDTVDPFAGDEDDTGGGLGVLRGIIQSHGGDIRFELMPGGVQGRVEIELPRADQPGLRMEAPGGTAGGRSGKSSVKMTAVIIEPDVIAQRTFVSLMAQQGHRVIPVSSADEALDLVQRVKCDLLACASRMPGFNWLTFYERVRGHADEFVLLMDENDIGHSFSAGEGHVLRKPLHEADFERVISAVLLRLDRPFAQTG